MKIKSFYLYSFVALTVINSSCSSFISLDVSILSTAVVYFRPEINSVALVNRAVPSNKKENIVESIISTEGYNQDKEGISNILQALNESMMNSPRLTTKLTSIEWKGDGSGINFPKPLG